MITYLTSKTHTIILISLLMFSVSFFAQNPNYWQAKSSMYSILPDNKGEIIFLGDSITDRCEWTELFENENIINRGLSGDKIQGVLNRLQEVLNSKPSKLFLMIGVNDLRHKKTIKSIKNNYAKLLKMIQELSPNTIIYIQSILPINTAIGNPKTTNCQINKVNAIIKSIAKKHKVKYIDIHSALLDKENNLDAKYSNDGLHINGKGYLVWKSIIKDYVGKSKKTKPKSLNLIKTIEIEGRQGVALDKNHYYVSGSKVLYKYSKAGELLLTNKTPFKKLPLKANHLGDIDYYNGELYTGVEFFDDGKAFDIQIVIYDAKTLKFKRFFKWEAASGQKEVCAVTVNKKTKTVWMADWINGSYLYKYNLESGKYLDKVHIFPVPEKQQGIKVIGNKLYITADDGDAELNEPDHLYVISINDTTTAKVELIKTFDDVKLQGEIEGLTYNESTKELIVHFNRGTRVVNGMPIGLHKGYTKEIHELYIYKF